jgi:hypothetical protein
MSGGKGDIEAAEAARNVLARIDELTLATTGKFFNANGQAIAW